MTLLRMLGALLTVALLFTSCSSTTTTTLSETANSDAGTSDGGSEEIEPTPEPEPTPTAVPEPTATPEPEPTPTPEPDNSEAAMNALESSDLGRGLTPAELQCVIGGIADDPDLLSRLGLSNNFDTLPLEDQAEAAIVVFDCAPEAAAAEFASGFTNDLDGIDEEMAQSIGDCMIGEFDASNPDRAQVLIGFVALGEDTPVPLEAQGPTADTMATCVPGPVFGELMVAQTANDPALAGAIDEDCARTAFTEESIRDFWGEMISSGASDLASMDADVMNTFVLQILDCISMGRVIAEQAATDGVILGESTIECIDLEMAGEDLAAMMTGGAPTDEQAAALGATLIGCMTPEEFAAFAAS